MSDAAEWVEELKAAQRDASYVNHPFVQSVLDGSMPEAAIGGWAIQQGYFARDGAESMAIIALRADDHSVKEAFFENLAGEIIGSEGHENHWILAQKLASKMGWSDDTASQEPPLPETQAVIDALMASATWRPWQEAVVLGGVCGEQPFADVAPLVSRALREHYGIDDPLYFSEHEEADVEHADTAWDVLTSFATTRERQERLRRVWELGTGIWWNYYDGLHRAYVQGLRPGPHARI